MLEPEEVSAILRLNELGWGAKRIAQELGISRNTAKEYIAAGGWTPYRQPRRKKALDGQEAWLWERFRRHRGNADVIRQELAAEKGTIVSLRTVERAVQTYRRELAAEARATVRFETPPGKQLQIDFGERLVEIFVRRHARLFAPAAHPGVPQRAARELVRGAGKHIHQIWRRHRGSFDRQPTGISGRA
jgi:transposase